jgi:hypothetical protein
VKGIEFGDLLFKLGHDLRLLAFRACELRQDPLRPAINGRPLATLQLVEIDRRQLRPDTSGASIQNHSGDRLGERAIHLPHPNEQTI